MTQHHLVRSLMIVMCSLAVSVPPVLAAPGQSMRFLRGEVLVDTTPEGWILVALDEATAEQGHDGLTDYLFRLQREGAKEILSRRFDSAELAVTDQSLRIRAGDLKASILLKVEGSPSPASTRPSDKGQTVLEGYGLSHEWGDFGESPADTVERFRTVGVASSRISDDGGFPIAAAFLVEKGCVPEPSCDTGGCFTPSCSISGCPGAPTSCSTSCSSGRFACCGCKFPSPAHAACGCFLEARFCC